jgi:ferric iron reductase protein FhuF
MSNTMSRAAMLAQVAALGPFFAFEEHGSAPSAPWHRLADLTDDPSVLRDRVTETRGYLGMVSGQSSEEIELRVAASVTHLGLVARLISPALAVAVLTGEVPSLDLEQVHWQPVLGGAFPLSLPATRRSDPTLADRLSAELFEGPIPALAEATRSFGVSDHILWGNVASAVNGAATMIATGSPDLAAPTSRLTTHLLAGPALRDTHTTTDGRFRRRSCCLIYRAAAGHAGPLCGDCALTQS